MIFSQKGLKLLMAWEGTKLKIYLDTGGNPSIGVGHLIQPHEDFSRGITTSQALDLLDKDISPFERDVNIHLKQPLTQDQFDCLIIFSYNIGQHGFDTSTALKDVMKDDLKDVPDAIRLWNKVNGHVDQGLVNRREKEIQLWNSEI